MIEQRSTNTPVASGQVTVYYQYPQTGGWGYGHPEGHAFGPPTATTLTSLTSLTSRLLRR